MPALKVNIIIDHPWDVVFPRVNLKPSGKTTHLGWTIMMFTLSAGINCILLHDWHYWLPIPQFFWLEILKEILLCFCFFLFLFWLEKAFSSSIWKGKKMEHLLFIIITLKFVEWSVSSNPVFFKDVLLSKL